ncbi:MAG: glycosyltransferase family 4 protein [Herpetosiphonaceae bacterium]|nr:glycosyltransferase family 4 protein [Herpetosiphonaceae bacterium]
MRVALVTGEYPPVLGGVGDYTARLAQALQARGCESVVITAETAALDVRQPAVERERGEAREPAVMRLSTQWGWDTKGKMLQALQLCQPEVVHIQYQTGAYGQHPAINLLPDQLHRRMRVPVVVTAHDLLLPYLFPKADVLRRWVTRRLLRGAAAVIVTNDEDQGRLQGRVVGDRQHASEYNLPCQLIPIGSNIAPRPAQGFDRDNWRAEHGLAGMQNIGYFGLMNASKGVLELVRAVARLRSAACLVIIGGAATNAQDRAYASDVRALISELGLQERVVWTGPCSQEEVSAYLLACDVIALPFTDGASYRRGSLLAALVHGCPVLTTQPQVQLNPHLEDGVAARIVPDAEPVDLAAALEELLQDAVLCRRLGAGAKALAEYFRWPAIAAAHEVVYNAVIR